MAFASPLWLLSLVPWAAVAIWLLLGRRRPVGVPFIKLWHGPVELPRAKPSISRPPLWVLLAILAMLCAVLASARPMLYGRTGVPVTIIVDRGITMSARGSRVERFKEITQELAGRLLQTLGDGPVRLISVPGGNVSELDRGNWAASVNGMDGTVQMTGPQLDAVARRTMPEAGGNLIVVSDQALAVSDRTLQIEPETSVTNLGITSVAARALPRAQVMVRLRDQKSPTPIRPATVRIESAGHVATQNVQVPRDGIATAFIDLPELGPTVSIDVDAPDDLPADNQAWLAREEAAASIEDSSDLSEPLRRMIAVYRRHREGGGERVAIVTNPAELAGDVPSVVIAPSNAEQSSPKSTLYVVPHPVSANVNWSEATDSISGTPPPGYRPIVGNGNSVYLAVRDEPTRSVWVCLNSPDWPTRAGYVIFWTNVFDWLGGEDVYQWHPVGDHHAPGVEKGIDGVLRAYNAIDVNLPPIRPNDWGRLRELKQSEAGKIDLTGATCLIAMALMISAILMMRTKSRARSVLAE